MMMQHKNRIMIISHHYILTSFKRVTKALKPRWRDC